MARVFKQRITWRLVALIASETALIVAAVMISAYLRLSSEGMTAGWVQKAFLIAVVCQV